MRATIDKAGRVVIPIAIRERAGLRPGTELQVSHEDRGILLVRSVPGPRLVRTRGRLVARASVAPAEPPDFAALIEQERDRWP